MIAANANNFCHVNISPKINAEDSTPTTGAVKTDIDATVAGSFAIIKAQTT